MGQRNGFSAGDVTKLKAMYKCNNGNSKPVSASHASVKPQVAGGSGGKYPVLNFIGNLVKPFLQEGSENKTLEIDTDINQI